MIRVLIVDDHAMFREGLREVLCRSPQLEVSGEASNGQEALAHLRHSRCDVMLLDIALEDRNGLDVLKQVKAEWPDLRVLMLTMHREEQYAVRALRAGAAGYLTKNSAATELVAAIQKVAAGGKYVSAALAERLAFAISPGGLKLPHEYLTDREFQVFSLLVSGKRITDVADQLCLSVKTVSTHRGHICDKMQMQTIAQLTRYAVANGLIEE